jgi:hypothetical protein|tara:strand:- start:111 stop:323 length:213 start_codon:yes stop_codon:yes gene_type:complete
MEKFTHVLVLLCGGFITWIFISNHNTSLHDVWITAYKIGHDQGSEISRYRYELTHEQLEAKCMFFYADEK